MAVGWPGRCPLFLAACGLLVGPPATMRGAGPVDVAKFLAAEAGFSKSEVERIHRGEVIAKNLAADDQTVAIAAAALLAVPADFFLAQVKRIEEFKKSPEVQQIGRVGATPSADDFARLSIDADELAALRRCRPGDCELKLDSRGIELVKGVKTNAELMTGLREHLAAYAAAYLRDGNPALITYNDRNKPLSLREEFGRILAASPAIARDWPDLHAGLAQFSGTLPEGLEGFVYWSKEKAASRSSVALTHLVIRPPAEGVAAVATKQIYSSHYTTASLGLTVLVDQTGTSGPRTLVIYLNRTRVDVFGGLLGGVKRALVRPRARSGAERMMATMRTRMEGQFRAALQ